MPDAAENAQTKVTLNDVAQRAGVSLAAASLAMRGKPGVSPSTRQRVIETASDIGYRARTPATSDRPTTIGILVKSRLADTGTTNAFYGPVIAGITDACNAVEVDVRLGSLTVDEHFDPVDNPRLVADDDIDGLLVLGAFLSDTSANVLGQRPVVLVDGYAQDPSRFCNIISDNVGGVTAATERMIHLGHRNIAFVGAAPDSFPSILERRRGYETTMRSADLVPNFVESHHDDPAACATAAATALGLDQSTTALVAANDEVAIAILGKLRGRVPDQVSLAGFDDIDSAALVHPALDTVAVDKRAMGRLAVSLLRHRMSNPNDPAFTVTQRASLVVRDSSAPVRADV